MTVNCAMTSSRSDTAPGHDYKLGSTIKVRSGYKIRDSADATTTLMAWDSPVAELAVETVGNGSMSLFGSTLAAVALSMTAALLSF